MKKARIIDIDFAIADVPDVVVFRAGDISYRLPRQKFADLIESMKSKKAPDERENQIPVLDQETFIEILRLQRLGIDGLDIIAQILLLNRTKIAKQYADALRRWDSQSMEDRLKARMSGDACKRPANFVGAFDNPAAMQMRISRGEVRVISVVPNVYRIAQSLKRGESVEMIARGAQLDPKDFERWLREHESLIDFFLKI
jgi:hypothetical protein